MHLAIVGSHPQVVSYLLMRRADASQLVEIFFPLLNKSLSLPALSLAVLLGDRDMVLTIYRELKQQKKAQANNLIQCPEIGHILHVAIVSRWANILEWLLTNVETAAWAKDFLENPNAEGQTPLAFAAEQGNLEALEWLTRAGANVNSQANPYQRTALHYAVDGKASDKLQVVKTLLKLGAKIGLESNEPGQLHAKSPLELVRLRLDSDSQNPRLKAIRNFLQNEQQISQELDGFKLPMDVEYKNLVLKGGGAKGLAYIGALQTLEEKGV